MAFDLGGAMSGAQIGSAFGPWGALAGGVIGAFAAGGARRKAKAQQERNIAQMQREANDQREAFTLQAEATNINTRLLGQREQLALKAEALARKAVNQPEVDVYLAEDETNTTKARGQRRSQFFRQQTQAVL